MDAGTAFAENIRDLLVARSMTQVDLANASGLTPGAIANILSGHRPNRVTIDTARKIANVFGMTVDYMLSDHPCQHRRLRLIDGEGRYACERCDDIFVATGTD